MKFLKKKIIYGCESRGDGGSAYLTRLTVFECKLFAVYLHKFHRSDAEDFHDHPWGFCSLILWRGYEEERPRFVAGSEERRTVSNSLRDRRRVWPGMLLVRPATTIHRVVLIRERPAYSLVVRGPYVRNWGFFVEEPATRGGRVTRWQSFKAYFKERGC